MTEEPFSCVRGNLTIRGHIFREKDGILPAVILSHSFLTSEKACRSYAELLAELGYAAFTFDFCGGGKHSKSDGNTQDMTMFTEIEDLCAVIDYVKSRSDIDGSRLSLMGQSMGGAVSAITARRRSEDIDKLIMFYPALCIPDDARAGKMIMFRFDPENVPDLIAKFPAKLGGDYAKSVMDTDIYKEIGGFDKPVLLVHGTKDKIVNISYAEKAQHCYPSCTYYVIEGGGHGFTGKYDKEAADVLSRFMSLE